MGELHRVGACVAAALQDEPGRGRRARARDRGCEDAGREEGRAQTPLLIEDGLGAPLPVPRIDEERLDLLRRKSERAGFSVFRLEGEGEGLAVVRYRHGVEA